MASSSSKSAQAVVGDDQPHDPKETTMVEDETSDTEVIYQLPHLPKRRWSPLDDAKLLVHVVVNGSKMWKTISREFPGRSGHACRVRWKNHLKPCLKDSPFKKQEELDLMVAHARYDSILRGKINDSVKAHFHELMAENRRAKMVNFSAAAVSPPSAIFTDSNAVALARSLVRPRRTANSAGSGTSNSGRSTFICIACRFNWHSNVVGERTFMADCRICRRVLEMGGHLVNGYLAPSRANFHQAPSVIPSVSAELSLATTVYTPQPPPPPASPSTLPPVSPPSPPPPPTFIDFLGVGSV